MYFPRSIGDNKFIDDPYNEFLSTLHSVITRADILHYFGTDCLIFALLPRLTRKKIVLTLDGLEWRRSNYPAIIRFVLKSYAALALIVPNVVFVDNKPALEWYMANIPRRYFHLPYGTTPSYRLASETALKRYGLEPSSYIVYTGRLVPEKGAHLLIEAFKRIKTNMKLVIVGGATKDTYGYTTSLKTSRDPRIIFTGFVYGEDYEELLRGAYLYAHPSLLEGTPISLLTALGFGKCVLASDLRENREITSDAGVFFSSGNVDRLKEKLEYLLLHPSRVKQAEEKARKRVSHLYDWDKIVDQLETVYENLVKNHN